MDIALHKTLAFLVLIIVGLLMRRSLRGPGSQQALKQVILNLALPAVIFVALLKLQVGAAMLVVPLATVAFNLVMLGCCWLLLPAFGVARHSAEMRTFLLLLPSLAPGLSCFSFVSAFLGEEALAHAALADVGNKVSVLFFSYLLAMHWFYRLNSQVNPSGNAKLKSLALGMLKEPINLVMVLAVFLLGCDIHVDAFPPFLSDAIGLLGQLMTPLILLYVGISVTADWRQFLLIGKLLMLRAGIACLFSAVLLVSLPGLPVASALLIVAFPQSACSFWPLAHMGMVGTLGKAHRSSVRVFDDALATNLLALSLPFSITVILALFNGGATFVEPVNVLSLGAVFLVVSALLAVMTRRRVARPKADVGEVAGKEAVPEVREAWSVGQK